MENSVSHNGILDQSMFLKRVTGYPVVNRVWVYTSDAYGKVKEYNGIVKFTLDTAECAVLGAADRAKPVIAKLEVPITVVDSLACKTLDKLEETVPLVKQTPEEIVSETKKQYNDSILEPALIRFNSVKAYGLCKVSAVTEYGMQTALVLTETKYGQMLTVAVDQMLLKADTYVDSYIPPGKLDEQIIDEPRMNDDGKPLDKVVVLSKKFRQRLVYHGLVQLQAAKKRTDEILANLQVTVDLIYHAKSDYLQSTNKAVRDRLDKAQTKVLQLWEELNKNADVNGVKTVEQKLLFVAQYLTNQLHTTYQKLSSALSLLPAHIQPNVKLVQDYITELYNQFATAQSWDDLSMVVVGQWRDGVSTLQSLCTQYFDSFLNSRLVSWLVKPTIVDERKVVTQNGLPTTSTPTGSDHANGPSSLPSASNKTPIEKDVPPPPPPSVRAPPPSPEVQLMEPVMLGQITENNEEELSEEEADEQADQVTVPEPEVKKCEQNEAAITTTDDKCPSTTKSTDGLKTKKRKQPNHDLSE